MGPTHLFLWLQRVPKFLKERNDRWAGAGAGAPDYVLNGLNFKFHTRATRCAVAAGAGCEFGPNCYYVLFTENLFIF